MQHASTAYVPRPRPRWWTELPLLALVYAAYSAGRLVARGDVSTAVDHGLRILHLEKALHINFEHPLNRLLTAHPSIGIPADFIYATLHYLVTPVVLVWLFRRRQAVYRRARTWLMTSTLLGLIGFALMPTCPPRLLHATHGFVDTMAQYSSYGWWGSEASAPRGMGGMTNQYAAMPSLHVGWALWCGILLWRHGRHPLVRAAGIAYPLVTTFVVMGTANHYFLDAVAGAAVMGVGALLAGPVMRIADRVTTRFPRFARTTKSPIVSAGCKTSAGERIPGQRTTSADSTDAAASADADASAGRAPRADAAAPAGAGAAGDDTPAAAR
ncbi:phosphatase PAP2 family protein [Streptomyces sp. Ncost-T10-10d]|uniref:phosphatase PAP2 family protein n=1 Tax=Streptomyces sp. Ncost-T10-10d TaxID=1839774 RepID=UPI00081D4C16|nr:phosphatase PAP2 family protein [Streptomyces sp. Ncost-T10-10d]SCF97592.1 PAP2 superfamily protein [Streptomyces sp. Ncost-T10-10d]